MNNSVIIAKNPGFIIPQAFYQTLAKNHKSAIGYAVRVEVDGKSELVIGREEGIPSEAEFEEMMKEAKDFPGIYWLCHQDGKLNTTDIQPFSLSGDGKTDFISYFIEGSFDDFEGGDTSAAFKLNKDIIEPHLSDLYAATDGDPQKFIERLGGALSQRLILSTVGKRGVFAFLPAEGPPVVIGKNELGGEYEWGNVSQHHGYSEKPGVVEQVVSSVKKKFSLFKDNAEPAPTEVKTETNPNAGKETLTVDKPEPSTTTTSSSGASTSQKAGGKYIKIPSDVHGKKRKQWLRKAMGLNPSDALPSGHEKLTEVWVADLVAGPIKDLKEVGNVIDMKAAAPKPAPTKGSEVAAARSDNASTISKDTVAKARAVQGTSALIEPAKASAAQDWLLKHYDRSSQPIGDPSKMQEHEAKYPSFSDKVEKLEATFGIPADMLWDFSTENPKAAFLMLLEYRRAYTSLLEQHDMLPKATPEPVTEVKSEAVSSPASTKTNGGKSTVREKASVPSSPAPEATPEPVKKSGFFSRMAG